MSNEHMTRKQKIIFYIIMVCIQLFQMSGVILIAWLNNKLFEAFGIYFGMVCGKFCFKKSWHSDTLLICTLATWGVFYFLTSGALPSDISIFCSVIIGFFLAYLLYELAILKERVNTKINISNEGGFTKVNLKYISIEEITKICQDKLFSVTDTNFLIDFIKNPSRMTNIQIADKYCYDEKYIYKKAKNLIAKLNIKVD